MDNCCGVSALQLPEITCQSNNGGGIAVFGNVFVETKFEFLKVDRS